MTRPRAERFEAVFEESESALVSYAGLFVRDLHAAREIATDVFLRFTKLVPLPEGRDARIRLFASCRKHALAAKRRLPAAAAPPVRWKVAASDTQIADLGAPVSLEAASILAHLGEKLREPVVLRFQHGFSSREISTITGHSPGNVLFLLHAGMRRMRGMNFS